MSALPELRLALVRPLDPDALGFTVGDALDADVFVSLVAVVGPPRVLVSGTVNTEL